jgi:hypothetical protein
MNDQKININEKPIESGLKNILVLVFMVCWVFPAQSQVKVVTEGIAQAVVVTAEKPTETAAYAVQELVKHVKLATDVILDIIPESKAPMDVNTLIYVGQTKAALRQGIDVERLPRETFVMRSVGNDLFILGRESDANPLDRSNPDIGTLFGVYEFLEEFVGVRWLWPGELGTYIPRTNTINVPAIKQMEEPALLFRRLRSHGHIISENSENARLGFSPEVARNYHEALDVLYRRHRMGGMDVHPPTGHNTIDWRIYGDKHPEWFVLTRNGTRGNPRPGHEDPQISLCVTNEELQDFIVEQWDGKSTLVLGPEDAAGRCICDKCRAWDGPQPKTAPWFATLMYDDPYKTDVFYGQTSDRYARFWKIIREKAAKQNPNVLVSVSYLYENEFTAPVTNIKLDKNFYGEFVQWRDPNLRYFPMPEAAFEWIKEQWLGWKKTGIRMGYRPNYLHDGYVMPYFDTWQSGKFFKFAYEHGMEGTDFDMNTGQWAVQGLRLYMHLRLHSNPELKIKKIREEYFSAFGPAAESIKRFCDYWENYAIENVLNFIENMEVRRYAKYPLQAHEAFPLKVFAPATAILEQALEEARTSPQPEFEERVKFLQVGIEHARLTVKLAAIYNGNQNVPEDRLDEAKEALRKLVQFRKDNQHLYFSDLYHVTSFWEGRCWNMDYFSGL